MRPNIYQKVLLSFLLILVIFWAYLFINDSTEGFNNYFYSFLFGLTPFIGGLIAMYKSFMWGGFKSAVGKAVFFVGLGVFSWGCGEMIWSYYNFFMGVPAPYPSLADIGFAPSIFFYGLGAAFLSQATGARFGLRSKVARVFVVIAPIIVFFVSYYFLIIVARGGVLIPENETFLKAVLDIAYPFGDFVALCLAVIISGLSFQYFGGQYKYDVVAILVGLGLMFIGDAMFSYTTTVGTYYNANLGDLFLTLGTSALTYGVLGFCKIKSAHKA
ncbi:MAG: hypothetical protein M3Q73_01960 [bacterium]|nr:hypothetical protein [bacterium]